MTEEEKKVLQTGEAWIRACRHTVGDSLAAQFEREQAAQRAHREALMELVAKKGW